MVLSMDEKELIERASNIIGQDVSKWKLNDVVAKLVEIAETQDKSLV
jgi:uncharacterized protein (DUF1778 family)